MTDMEAFAQEFKKKLAAMTKEEFEKEILHLNGRMTQKLFEKVFNELLAQEYLGTEELLYDAENFGISEEEFSDVFHYLDVVAGDKKEGSSEHGFPEYLMLFEYKGTIFLWRLLIGQGSHCELALHHECLDVPIIKIDRIDPTIKFFKHLK